MAVTAVLIVGSAAVAWLVAHGKPASAGVATVFILAYLAAELWLYVRRHSIETQATRAAARAAGARLAGYTPQTVDWEWEWWEAGRP